jgi:hypothetical protein
MSKGNGLFLSAARLEILSRQSTTTTTDVLRKKSSSGSLKRKRIGTVSSACDACDSTDNEETQASKMSRRNSHKQFRRFSSEVSRKSSRVTSVLDGRSKRSSCVNTEVLRTREQMNQLQRVKNDRAINIMLITVSVSFLILTFPYQLVWVCDQIYQIVLSKKIHSNMAADEESETTIEYDFEFFEIFKRDIWMYHLISNAIKDLALIIRNLNFAINFFLYSTMSNLFRKELNCIFQSLGCYKIKLFQNGLSTSMGPNSDYMPLSRRSRMLSFGSSEKNPASTSKV